MVECRSYRDWLGLRLKEKSFLIEEFLKRKEHRSIDEIGEGFVIGIKLSRSDLVVEINIYDERKDEWVMIECFGYDNYKGWLKPKLVNEGIAFDFLSRRIVDCKNCGKDIFFSEIVKSYYGKVEWLCEDCQAEKHGGKQ